MHLAIGAEARESGIGQARLATGRCDRKGKRGIASTQRAGPQVREGGSPGPRCGRREAAADHLRRQIHGIDQRAADVAGDRADAHAGEGLAQARLERRDQIRDGGGRRHRLRTTGPREFRRQFDGQAWVRRRGADGQDHGHRVHGEDVRGVHHDVGATAQACLGEGRVHGAGGQDGGDREPIDRERGVADHEDLDARPGRGQGFRGQSVQGELEPDLAMLR